MTFSGVRTFPSQGISPQIFRAAGAGLHIAIAIARRISLRTSSTVVWCLRATSSRAASARIFICFTLLTPCFLERLSFLWSYNTTGVYGKYVERSRKKQRSAKSKPLSYCYWNSVINASSTFITLRCPSGESVFKRSESSVARSIVAAFKLS